MSFGVAKTYTPVLNTPDFSSTFRSPLPLDEQGLLRRVEFVALPQTKFVIKEMQSTHIFRIETKEYPGENLFVDERFLKYRKQADERSLVKISDSAILRNLQEQVGKGYVWGGNSPKIGEMQQFYPIPPTLDSRHLPIWTFDGFDCSGLLYYATGGATPRNTSGLIQAGKPVPIGGLSAQEIAARVQPLDIFVWKGHVFIVLDDKTTIESRVGSGVVTANLLERVKEVMKERKPLNSWETGGFVVRRNAYLPYA